MAETKKEKQRVDKGIGYKETVAELETILEQLESNELEIDELTGRAKRATELLKICKDKLYKTEEEVNQIMEDKK